MLKNPLMLLPILGAFAAVGVAQQPSMLPYLPADTVMAMSMPDLDASMAEFGAMPLAKMWHEQEVQNFVQDAREMVAQQIQKAMDQAKEMHKQGQMPIDPSGLMALRVKGASFALTRMSMAIGDAGPMPTIGLMLQLEFGDTAQQWFSLMEMGMGMLSQTGEMERSESLAGETKILTFKPKIAPPGMTMALNVAMVKNGVILGTLLGDVKSTVENMQKGTQVLAATDRYKNGSKHITTDGTEVEMFMRLDPMLDFAMQALEIAVEMNPDMAEVDVEGIGRALDALGVRALKSVSSSSSYQNGRAVSTTYMAVPAPERKGIFAGGDKTVDMGFLKWVPKDAVSFSAMTIEPMSVYEGIVGAMRAYDPKFAEEAMAHLAAMEKQIGFNLRDDLFGAVGDSMITWSLPLAGITAPPEMAFLIKVNDEQKIVKVLKSLSAMSDGQVELEEAEKRGVKTYQIRLNIDMQGMPMNPLESINPSFAFNKGYMVASFSASDIRRAFQRMDRTEDDPKTDIRGNKEFAAYAEKLPEGVQSISFTDWKTQFESGYQTVSSLVAFLPPSEDIPFDWQMLPDSSTLTKHLYGSLSYLKADANGYLSTTTGPFGPEVMMLLGAMVAAGVAVGTLMEDF